MIKQISKNERIQSKKKPWTDIIPNLKRFFPLEEKEKATTWQENNL